MRNMTITSIIIYDKERDAILLCKDKNLWDAKVIPSVVSISYDDSNEIIGTNETKSILEIEQNLSVDLGRVVFIENFRELRTFNGSIMLVTKKLFVCQNILGEPNNDKKAYTEIIWEPANKYRLSYDNENQALRCGIDYIDCIKFDVTKSWGVNLNTLLYMELHHLPYIKDKKIFNTYIDNNRKEYMHILNKNIPDNIKEYCMQKIEKLNSMYKN